MAFKIAEAYVEVTADDSAALTKVEALQRELDTISDKRINLDITDAEAMAKIEEIKLKLAELSAHDRDINIRLHAEEALAEAEQVKGALREIDDEENRLGETSKRTEASMGGLFSNIAPFIIPAIASVGQLTGVLGLIPSIALGAGLAFATLKIGTEGFKDAVEKGGAALDKLSPSARATAEAIRGLQPAFESLKMDVQQHLFEGLGQSMKDLGSSVLPVVRSGLTQMADGLNLATRNVVSFATSKAAISDYKVIFDNIGSAAHLLAAAVQPILKIFTDLSVVGSQFLPSLAAHFAEAAQRVADFISHARETGQLRVWIQTGIDAVGKLWDALKNLVEIIIRIGQVKLFGADFLSMLDLVTKGVLKLVTTFPELIPLIAAVVVAWKAWTVAQIALDAAMAANPIGLIVIAIGALILVAIEVVKHWTEVKQSLIDTWNAIKSAAETVFNAIKDFFTGLWNTVKQNFVDSWNQIKDALTTAWNAIKDAAQAAWDALKSVFSTAWDAIKQASIDTWNTIRDALASAWDAIKSAAQSAWDVIKSAISAAWDAIKSTVSSAVNSVKSTLSAAWDSAKSTAQSAWNALVSAVKSTINDLLSAVRAIPGQITSALGNLSGLLVQAGKNVIQGLINGIKSMAGAVGSAISGIASQIRGALPFSPAKWGPLSGSGSPDIAGGIISEMIAEGMISRIGAVASAAQQVAGTVLSGLPDIVQYGTVSQATWNSLLAAGWTGRSGDGMEALYRPSGSSLGASAGGSFGSSAVQYGSVSDSQWQALLTAGWQGNPNDGTEALYPPSSMPTPTPSKGTASGSYSDLPDVVQWGTVPQSVWFSLLAAGWKGRSGDGMEALYRPEGSSSSSGSTGTGSVPSSGPVAPPTGSANCNQNISIYITQVAESPSETGRAVALALRTVS